MTAGGCDRGASPFCRRQRRSSAVLPAMASSAAGPREQVTRIHANSWTCLFLHKKLKNSVFGVGGQFTENFNKY